MAGCCCASRRVTRPPASNPRAPQRTHPRGCAAHRRAPRMRPGCGRPLHVQPLRGVRRHGRAGDRGGRRRGRGGAARHRAGHRRRPASSTAHRRRAGRRGRAAPVRRGIRSRIRRRRRRRDRRPGAPSADPGAQDRHDLHRAGASLPARVRGAARVRNATALGRAGRSLVRLALDLADSRIADWSALRVLLVGTGSYAAATLAALRDHGASDISVYSPSGRGEEFALKHGIAHTPADAFAYAAAHADLVITCTSVEQPVVDAALLHRGPGRARRRDGSISRPRTAAERRRRRREDRGAPVARSREPIRLHAPLEELQATDYHRAVVTEAARRYDRRRQPRRDARRRRHARARLLGHGRRRSTAHAPAATTAAPSSRSGTSSGSSCTRRPHARTARRPRGAPRSTTRPCRRCSASKWRMPRARRPARGRDAG